MNNRSQQLKYAASHEWVSVEEGDQITVGITDHAQDLLGDLVFADLPEVGQTFAREQVCMTLESVKAASDIYMPLSGKVVAINSALEDEPELINEDAFGDGWLFKMVADDISELDSLLTEADYEASLNE